MLVFWDQVPIEETTRRLRDSGHKLGTIAQETGFAKANHLCKVFRRHFHLSPAIFDSKRDTIMFKAPEGPILVF